MAAPTLYYVDPAIAANTGAGTIGSPYGDLQYALNTVTRDATNGNQFNIKAGTDEVLTAALSLTTYGTPTTTAPLIFRGYTSAANDGGIGAISGAGSFSIFASTTLDAVIFFDLKCYNTGSNVVIQGDDFVAIVNCEITGSSGGGLLLDASGLVLGSIVHNTGGAGISIGSLSRIVGCFLKNGAADFTTAISCTAGSSIIEGNIISVDGASGGISAGTATGINHLIKNNSVYSNGGTGTGLLFGSNSRGHTVINNIIEGFSGVGGKGIDLPTGRGMFAYGNNKYYNSATNETLSGDIYSNLGNNDTLLASPFTNPAGDDFSVSAAVKAGAYPSSFRGTSTNNYLDVGAAQRQEPTGGGRASRIRGHGI